MSGPSQFPAGQTSLPDVLMRPAAYPHPVARVKHLQTHISHIFLAGDYAYKLKKPVDLGFLDFTTPEKRIRACEDELRLNRRLAPDIYLDVVNICLDNGHYRLVMDKTDAPGDVIDAMVRMRRMPRNGMLDRLAGTGRLTGEHIRDIAHQMARFHAAGHRPELDRYGDPDAIMAPVRQNFQQIEPYLGNCLSHTRLKHLREWPEAFLRGHYARFEARIARGRIVDGHGDLHLGNMCLVDDRVVIFDCIEFNPALRSGDAIGDIAFLTMDLIERGRPALANDFLNAYLDESGDYHGVALLDFYQVYRAVVRGKINAFQCTGDGDGVAREHARSTAADYFALAERLQTPRRGGLLITCGLSGSGKTTLARQAVRHMDGVMIRSDIVRKRLAGMSPQQRDCGGFDQGIYTPAVTARTYATLLEHARDVIAAGRWAILDATYQLRIQRTAAAALARELHVPFAILYCTAPHDELIRRLDARSADNRDASDATASLLGAQSQRFEPPSNHEGTLHTCTPAVTNVTAWLRTLATAPTG